MLGIVRSTAEQKLSAEQAESFVRQAMQEAMNATLHTKRLAEMQTETRVYNQYADTFRRIKGITD